MIINNGKDKYRPGEDDLRDEEIYLLSTFDHGNYVPSREEIIREDD
jgi:hypothetical protein